MSSFFLPLTKQSQSKIFPMSGDLDKYDSIMRGPKILWLSPIQLLRCCNALFWSCQEPAQSLSCSVWASSESLRLIASLVSVLLECREISRISEDRLCRWGPLCQAQCQHHECILTGRRSSLHAYHPSSWWPKLDNCGLWFLRNNMFTPFHFHLICTLARAAPVLG